ncbi:hypothetical protein T440DRAFT_69121 [Plenodomus tracheiphilus IPT5]|uniref:Uncharacterized protein n=1 Tax=Plenodomus tracheiphilus IPT5 TaxID=1408161 RepID=A0A6A7B7A4_9PLEO|nr:hypothetical protein T440DRAFT_69121 [Plenodomus tracheiphilus IPT5]
MEELERGRGRGRGRGRVCRRTLKGCSAAQCSAVYYESMPMLAPPIAIPYCVHACLYSTWATCALPQALYKDVQRLVTAHPPRTKQARSLARPRYWRSARVVAGFPHASTCSGGGLLWSRSFWDNRPRRCKLDSVLSDARSCRQYFNPHPGVGHNPWIDHRSPPTNSTRSAQPPLLSLRQTESLCRCSPPLIYTLRPSASPPPCLSALGNDARRWPN